MRVACLASSSAGNCFALEFGLGGGQSASVLVECGLPYGTIVRKLAEDSFRFGDICGVLVTHSHKDHSLSARELDSRGFRIVATKGTMAACGVAQEPTPYGKAVVLFSANDNVPLDRRYIYAQPFPVSHDAPEPAGFVIGTNLETVVFGIDSSGWDADLSAYRPDYVFCEADYDGEIMDAEQRSLRAKTDQTSLQRFRHNVRTINQHMSIDKAIRTVRSLDLSNCKEVFLTHLSDLHGAPNAFKTKARANLGVDVSVCLKNGGIL